MNRFAIGFLLLIAVHVANAEDLPTTRRLLILTQDFLNSAGNRQVPAPIPGDKSRVLVLFRVSEKGAVMDTRASGGSNEATKSALSALATWRFRPTLLSGRPAQMQSGVIFDFSTDPVRAFAPPPMRADQISPVLSARCSLALVENDRDAVGICKKENAAVEKNASHTAMESFSAHDELGVALLRFGNNPVQAIKEFDQAMQLAPQGLNPSDGEWGQLYWHRATARLELKQFDEASQDFDVAEKSYSEAAASSGIASYRDTLSQIAKQHASLLNAQGKHDEAEAVLKKTAQ